MFVGQQFGARGCCCGAGVRCVVYACAYAGGAVVPVERAGGATEGPGQGGRGAAAGAGGGARGAGDVGRGGPAPRTVAQCDRRAGDGPGEVHGRGDELAAGTGDSDEGVGRGEQRCGHGARQPGEFVSRGGAPRGCRESDRAGAGDPREGAGAERRERVDGREQPGADRGGRGQVR